MKTASDIRIERWEDDDFTITGLHQHVGVYSKREAELIVGFLNGALPLINTEAYKAGLSKAAEITEKQEQKLHLKVELGELFPSEAILTHRDNLKEIPCV